jgi:hypothetical protein
LYADRIGDLTHDAAQRIYFSHQVALGDAADGGVARHLCDQIEIEAEQCGAQSHPRSSHGGFATGMSGTHHDNVVLFRKGHNTSILELWRDFELFHELREGESTWKRRR